MYERARAADLPKLPGRVLTKVAIAVAMATTPQGQAATINVNTSCTLRDAIVSANTDSATGGCSAGAGADTINLPSGDLTYSLAEPGVSVLGYSALPVIDSEITLQGDGTAIRRNPAAATPDFRLLTVTEGGSLTIDDVTLAYGRALAAGAIFCAQGELTVSNSRFRENRSSIQGGAIGVTQCSLTIQDSSSFVDNYAGGNGGAVYSAYSMVSISDASFFANGGDAGGAIAVETASLLEANNIMLEFNIASVGAGLFSSGSSSISLTNSQISQNTAVQSAGAIGLTQSYATLQGVSMSSNDAGQDGGAMSVRNSSLTLGNSQLHANTSDGPGGALYILNSSVTALGSSISSNTATSGGGIRLEDSILTVSGSTISRNSATSGAGVFAAAGSELNLYNTTVSQNSASFAIGGISLTNSSLWLVHATVAQNGGGNYASGIYRGGISSDVSLVNSIVASNAVSDCNTLADTVFVGNWFGDASCSGDANGDPRLGPLASNGGPTQTHALLSSSGAINAALSSFCQNAPIDNKDQRGFERIGACDSGAFEFGVSDTSFFVIPLPNGGTVVVPL